MKKILAFAAAGLLMVGFVGCNEKSNASKEAQEAMDSLSMLLGDQIGMGMAQQMLSQDSAADLNEAFRGLEFIANADTSKSFAAGMQFGMYIAQMYNGIEEQFGMPINKTVFVEHLRKAFTSATPLTQEQMMKMQEDQMKQQETVQRLQDRIMAESPKAKANKEAGKKYMSKLKNDKSYKFTKSGLAYKVLAEGEGKNFSDTDVVKVNYVGRHIDGSEFDKSGDQPTSFNLQQVVPGFAEMIQMMKPGSKVTVVIPGELAYGAQGHRGVIEPFETLVFDIETLGVDDAPKRPQIAMPQGR